MNTSQPAQPPADGAPKMRGPHAYYRPKDPKPTTLNLTRRGKERLKELSAEHGKAYSDVVENLLIEQGHRVHFA